MKTFVYNATDSQGNKIKNAKLTAEDVNDFMEKISRRGLFCSSYKEVKMRKSASLHKFNTKELSFNSRQLSAMLSSGLTLVKALDILQKEQEKKGPQQVFLEVYEEVQKGQTFSDALKMQRGAFPVFFVSMIQAGEVSGNLDIIAKRLEENYAKDARLNNKIKGALMYPIILTILAVGIVIGMFTFIMPSFKDMMSEDDMKGLTGFMFAFSENMIEYWYVYVIVVAAIIFAIVYLLKVPSVRFKLDEFMLKAPYFGKLITKVYTGKFARTLASLYGAGISMVESLERSAAILSNAYVDKCFETVVDEVKQGEALSVAIQRTGIFESMFVSIIFVGEESGSLDTILEKSADYYDEESESAIQRIVQAIEPIMIIFMGIMVMLIIVSILPAIYNSMGNIT